MRMSCDLAIFKYSLKEKLPIFISYEYRTTITEFFNEVLPNRVAIKINKNAVYV